MPIRDNIIETKRQSVNSGIKSGNSIHFPMRPCYLITILLLLGFFGCGIAVGADVPATSPSVSPAPQGGDEDTQLSPVESIPLPPGWLSLEMKGATIEEVSGRQQITVDREMAGDALAISGSTLTFVNSGVQILVATDGLLTPNNNTVSGIIEKITIRADPVYGENKELSVKYLGTFEADYAKAPLADSGMKITLLDAPSADIENATSKGAEKQGFAIKLFGHSLNIQTINLDPPTRVRVGMSILPDWVNAAGRTTIRIAGLSDDGAGEVLETQAFGYDQFGNNLFIAESSRPCSTFVLLSALKVSEPVPETTASPVPTTPAEQPSITTTTLPLTSPAATPVKISGESAFQVTGIFAPALFAVLVIEGIGFLYLIRSWRKKD